MFQLTDRVAIVTGASRGIGEAIALAFAKAGARVVCCSRKLEGVQAVAGKIEAQGGQAHAVACHTGKAEDVAALVRAAVDRFGRIDVLVNNAATNPYFGPLADAPEAAWDKTF